MGTKIANNFVVGQDQDTDERAIKGYRFAINSRVGSSEKSNVGSIENVLGNTLVNYTLPSGYNREIGSCTDLENNALIYFVYNNNGHDSILRYKISTNTIECILQGGLTALFNVNLNFSSNLRNRINHCFVVQGLLFWTDGVNPPRKINIDKALAYTNNVWSFTDNQYTAGFVSFIGTQAIPSSITVGSSIYIQQDAGFTNPQYNTTAIVTAVTATSVVTDIPFGTNTLPEGGQLIIVDEDIYTYVNEQTIDRIKWPPKFSPYCTYVNDFDFNFNYLRGSTFQFTYQYVYDDNETSVAAPITKMPIQYNEETLSGDFVNELHYNNCIDINVNTSTHTVKAIKIYARSNSETDDTTPVDVSCNNSMWYLVDRIEKYKLDGTKLINDDITYTYKFYSDKIKDIADPSDIIRLFDYVPILCDSSALIEKNKIVDGDITEGYDNVDIDVSLTTEKEIIEFGDLTSSLQVTLNALPHYAKVTLPTTVSEGDIIQVNFTQAITDSSLVTTTNPVIISHIIGFSDIATYPQSVAAQISLKIGSIVGSFVTPNSGPYEIFIYTYYAPNSTPYAYINNPAILATWIKKFKKAKDFKDGASHQFGLVYYDRANRSSASNVSDDSTIYVPLLSEEMGTAGLTTTRGFRSLIKWNINHIPPDWATHYQWVYSKNTSILNYTQYNIKAMSYVDGKVRISFNPSISDYNTKVPKSILNSWIWKKGDRIRFILFGSGVNGQWTFVDNYNTTSVNYLDKVDYEIIGYDATTNEFIIEYFDTSFFITDIGVPINEVVVEVYRPKKNISEQILYEIGECFEIGDAGLATRYHKGGTQDQTALQPATGTFDSGDCYYKLRWASQSDVLFQYFPCESEHLSDFYVSDSCDIGRPNVVDRNQKQRRLIANFRWGGQLIQNTQINDICKFEYLNIEQLADKFGNIESLIEVGNVLKAIQHTKCTSIYVGLASTAEADGTTNLYVKSSTIGTIRVPVEIYGTKHPESCVSWNRALYFFDEINGQVIRDSANGLFPISDYGMVSVFKTWRDQMNGSMSTLALGAYEKDKEQYILSLYWNKLGTVIPIGVIYTSPEIARDGSFLQETPERISRKATYSFCEPLNEWKSDYNFFPEGYAYAGNAFAAFLNGQFWLQNSNQVHGNFFGVKYPQKVTFICNIEPTSVKRFLSLAYDSNKAWSATIKIPACDEYPNGMTSRLIESKFVLKEGFYYADFLNDMSTPGFINQLEALLNGRNLIGKTIEITLENNHPDHVVLYSAYVNVNKSYNSGTE
jgi:hypothetical protein